MYPALAVTGHAAGSAPGIAYVASALVIWVFVCGPMYLVWAVRRRGNHGDDDGDGDGGGGGGGRGGGRTPPKDSPGGDPEWWPEFERQFASHVAGRLADAPDLTPTAQPDH